MIARIFLLTIVMLFAIAVPSSAQSKKNRRTQNPTQVERTQTERHIAGIMIDAESGDPIPFSNVNIRRTIIGTQTDMDGLFSLNIPAGHDTVWFSAMGFVPSFVRLTKLSKAEGDTLVVRLKPESLKVEEIMVRPDDAPQRLVKAVLAAKVNNNPADHQRTECEKYSRWEYSLSNISDKAQRMLFLKNAENLMQVSSTDSSRYLPVYFSETLSKNETQREPRKVRSTILADRTKGIDVFKQYEIGGYSSAMDNDANFYDDVVKVFGVSFVSPIAKDCFRYYDYFIIDSSYVAGPRGMESDSTKVYTVRFRPKNEGDKAFRGTMDIETRRFSPISVEARMPKWTNINFVKSLYLFSTYQMVDDTIPFFGTSTIDAEIDYMPVASEKKRLGIRCVMHTSQSKVRLDMPEPLELSKKALAVETFKSDGYKSMDDDFWEERRHKDMSEEEKNANALIDSLNNVGSVKAFNLAAKAAITGFVDVGRVEVGPIGEMFNTNKIESVHAGLGLRTSKEISEQFVVSGIVGLGFKNLRPTYGAGLGYKFKTPMRQTIELDYYDRLIKIGEDENILYLYENMLSTSETNIVAQLFKREEIDELMYAQKLRLRYDREWYTGMQTRLQASIIQQESPKYYPFTQGGETIDYLHLAELSLDFRFSFREKFMDDGLMRMYLSSDFPIFHFTVAGGRTKAGDTSEDYGRLHSTMKHCFHMGQTRLDLAVENGIYFGKLPYTMLNIARGNKTFGFYRYDFNLMNYLEFVCDKYIYLYADYALDGFLLNKIPFVHKIGFREVVGAKIMFGGLSDKHLEMLDMPAGVGGPSEPYAEVNVGLDNIFRFLRLDVVWKVIGQSDLDSPRWGIRAQLNLKL